MSELADRSQLHKNFQKALTLAMPDQDERIAWLLGTLSANLSALGVTIESQKALICRELELLKQHLNQRIVRPEIGYVDSSSVWRELSQPEVSRVVR